MSQPAEAIIDSGLYIPQIGTIQEIREMTAREKYFRLELERPLHHKPGQFVMLTVPGVGECAISITCGPRDDNILEMVIRNAGSVTGVIHNLKQDDQIGVRGPFGNGFDLNDFSGKDLLFVAGGLGLAPLRSLLTPIMAESKRFGQINLITGARTPAETLFREELVEWNALANVNVIEMVDQTDHQPWEGNVGLVTEPVGALELDAANTLAVLVGPPVMYKFVIMELEMNHQIPHSQIYVDLERRMKCGVGKCGHCQINSLYCCQHGPVFKYAEISAYPEALS